MPTICEFRRAGSRLYGLVAALVRTSDLARTLGVLANGRRDPTIRRAGSTCRIR